MIFKKYHIEKILRGEKTMTRRLHKRPYRVGHTYRIKRDWYHWTHIYIHISRRLRQRLGDINPEDIMKEGYQTLEEFKENCIEINGFLGSRSAGLGLRVRGRFRFFLRPIN